MLQRTFPLGFLKKNTDKDWKTESVLAKEKQQYCLS